MTREINEYSIHGRQDLMLIKKQMFQLLYGLDQLHGRMILHRDLKPCNLLIDSDKNLKIADFGLSKKASFTARRKSNSIVSLWYRAPEIVLGEEEYITGVDMWSVGCILYDMLTGSPLFKV